MVFETEINELISSYPALELNRQEIGNSIKILIDCFSNGSKVFTGGNGGSASDAEHIVGEMLKGFEKKRPVNDTFRNKILHQSNGEMFELTEKLQESLPAICLNSQTSIITAVANDIGYDMVFAQQLMGLGKPGDVFIGLTTSGNAKNVLNAAIVAKALGLKVIGLTGQEGGKLCSVCDLCICVPETVTGKVQELHLPVYHTICRTIENHFYKY